MASDPILIAIDPGPEKSGWVRFTAASHYDNEKPEPIDCCIRDNEVCVTLLMHNGESWTDAADEKPLMRHLAVEMTESRGMAVGQSVHETTYWIGRLCQASMVPFTRIKRHEVKMHLCGSTRAKDSNIRQRLIDLWGGKDKAIGRKKTPGPLYGVKADCWQALALALTWYETCFTASGEVE